MSATTQAPNAAEHYDADYFEWQRRMGEFGGWANSARFRPSIRGEDVVVDFGCGGGFLLQHLDCRRKIGIEPNPNAGQSVRSLGFQHFRSPAEAIADLGPETVDTIISTNALEHALDPLEEIKQLMELLRPGGTIHFIVPCESIGYRYRPDDVNHHLFSWSPQALGNLFKEAGYEVISVKPYIHKWPPLYRQIARFGRPLFDLACRVYGRLERSWFQVELIGRKPNVIST